MKFFYTFSAVSSLEFELARLILNSVTFSDIFYFYDSFLGVRTKFDGDYAPFFIFFSLLDESFISSSNFIVIVSIILYKPSLLTNENVLFAVYCYYFSSSSETDFEIFLYYLLTADIFFSSES